MATIRRKRGNWQAIVRRKGYPPLYKTFKAKAHAQAWASVQEGRIEQSTYRDTSTALELTLGAALDRYVEKILPTKKSQQSVKSQVKLIKGHKVSGYSLANLLPEALAEFRDDRLSGRYGAHSVDPKRKKKKITSETVRKDLLLIHRVIEVARKEWGARLPHGNPAAEITLPAPGESRDRRLMPRSRVQNPEDKSKPLSEEDRLLKYARNYGDPMPAIITLALETAMRRTELTKMRWEHIDLKAKTIRIPTSKNGKARTVPLSPNALTTLKSLTRGISGSVFELKPDSITQAFTRICKKAQIDGLRLHDLRHEATTRLFERHGLNLLEAAAITGHQTLDMLKRYTHLSQEHLARKMALDDGRSE